VGLVGTLITKQALFWFALLFEKNFNNVELFLAAFAKAFGRHDKIH